MLIVQNNRKPAAVRNAIVDLISGEVTKVNIAVAYATKEGVELLINALKNGLGRAEYRSAPKELIASLDFGITAPEALEMWAAEPEAVVNIAGAERAVAGSLEPREAYHPKLYAFRKAAGATDAFVGSANLTSRGWSVNTEVGWCALGLEERVLSPVLDEARFKTSPLTAEVLQAYRKLRGRVKVPKAMLLELERVAEPKKVKPTDRSEFKKAIESGEVRPGDFGAMWIQVDSLSGGSGSQLELPRGAHRFFGFDFANYDSKKKETIGVPMLRSGARSWSDKILSWHGNNRMERMNLPTRAEGGPTYASSAVMFRRLAGGHFELVVSPWESDLARAWRHTSESQGRMYRLGGATSKRFVGLIE